LKPTRENQKVSAKQKTLKPCNDLQKPSIFLPIRRTAYESNLAKLGAASGQPAFLTIRRGKER